MEICRICNLKKQEDELNATIDYLTSETFTYKQYFERFTRTTYSIDKNLPQKICTTCQAEINLFIIKTDTWRRNERALIRPKRTVPDVLVKDERPKEVIKKPKMMAKKNAFDDIRKLFDFNEKDPLKDFEKFSRILVDHKHLEPDGEISNTWLEQAVSSKRVWSEMIFECNCKTKVKSLIGYLDHLKTHDKDPSIMINCPEKCDKVFSSLSLFINHVVSSHSIEYLCYCCISCGKLYYNIPALIKHYESKHPNVNNLYMCVECGMYCQNLRTLSLHKDLHYQVDEIKKTDAKKEVQTPKVSDKNDDFLLDTDISFSTANKRKHRRRSNNNMNLTLPSSSAAVKSFINLNKTMRTYHPKTLKFDESSSRPTYPCTFEGCTKILMTKSGFAYHMMVHTDTKPFSCDYCPKTFRSKQLKDSHTRNIHEEF